MSDSMSGDDATWIWASRLILLCVGLLGVAHVAFLPPFEGFDEPAYWSAIQQIADDGSIPQLGLARIAADFEAYAGPLPPGASGKDLAGRSYREYFSTPKPSLFVSVQRAWAPGAGLNYEAQHPPLYTLIIAPAYLVAKNWSWPAHLLLLRLVSWGLTFAGFAIGCRATMAALARLGVDPAIRLLVPAWPILFPEFLPEMARLGSDGLCLLIAAVAWSLVLPLLREERRGLAWGLGLSLGVGLLTKAFFLPIAGGTVLLILFAAVWAKNARYLRDAAIVGVVAVALGSGWYLFRYYESGSFTNLSDFAGAPGVAGILQILIQGSAAHELLVYSRGLAVMAISFVWAGTWSRAMLPPIVTLPVLVLMLWAVVRWLARIRRLSIEAAAPLFLVGPFLLGLLYHQLLWVATDTGEMSGTPGWSLHILAPALSLVLALGWQPSRPFRLLAAYAVAFHAVCWATQLSFFSGCAYKPGPRTWLRLDPGSCWISPAHLAALGEPVLGFAALATASVSGLAALALLFSRSARLAADRSLPTGSR